MNLYCPTEDAIFLLACKDVNGVLRFPSNAGPLPGISLKPRPLESINIQLIAAAEALIAVQNLGTKVLIEQGFLGNCIFQDRKLTLYCGTLDGAIFEAPKHWLTISEIIRSLMKDPNRVVFMKALQVFSGGLQSNVQAVAPEHLLTEPQDRN